jgi:hypothetical protein
MARPTVVIDGRLRFVSNTLGRRKVKQNKAIGCAGILYSIPQMGIE